MIKEIKYFILSFIILLSTPLGYRSIRIVYSNRNLTGEYVSILNGFIHLYVNRYLSVYYWISKYAI